MNQARSENKCSKRVSNESILNNYNFDDVSTAQNSICENCKQRGWTVCGKHLCHVGTVSNTEHVIEVAEVSQQQQTGTNNLCHQSLLQKAWVYLQSVTTRMSGCPRCNPKSPSITSVKSPSQSSIVSFQSSRSSPSPSASPSSSTLSCQQSCLSCMTSCHSGRSQGRPPCPRVSSHCRNARPPCPRAFSPCPKPPPPCPDVKPLSPKAKQTCPRPNTKTTGPHAKASCLNADCRNHKCPNAKLSSKNLQPPCPYATPPCPNAKDPSAEPSCPSLHALCPHAKPSSSKDKPRCPYAIPPCPNATVPSAEPSCPSLHALCPHAKPSSSKDKPRCPYAIPPCPNATDPSAEPSCPSLHALCPHAKPSSSKDKPRCPYAIPPCPNATDPSAEPSCPSLHALCPHAKPSSSKDKPRCPYAIPPCPNATDPSAEPSCPSLHALCPHAKPSSSKDKTPCPYAKPPCPNAKCPNAKPSCPSLQLPCPKAKPSNPNLERNSKTSLYHSFSNDSLCSMCKESLVELSKVYIHKLTSDHKIRCPRCAKRPTCANTKETMASYLRGIFDQVWSYFNTSIEQNTCPHQRVLSNCSNTSTSTRILESPSPDKSRCCCSKSPKTQSREAVCCSKPVSISKSVTIPDPVTCPTCLRPASTKPVTSPRPVSCTCLKPATYAKPATSPMFYKREGVTSPAQRSKEEGTHEHKSCFTPCCMHNSQGVQPSYNMSDKFCWSSQTSMNPLYISPLQVKTPHSVEELKASITGVTCLDKSSGNMFGCEILEFRSTMEYSKPCVRDLRDLICATDMPPKDMARLSLTLEQQKDHTFGSRPKDLKHSKESLDNCEETMISCNDLEEKTRKEGSPCPSSGGRVKPDEVLLDKDFDNPTEQVHSKEKICKSGRKSVTCVDSNQSDHKDCNAPEKEAYIKDPYNYKYYY